MRFSCYAAPSSAKSGHPTQRRQGHLTSQGIVLLSPNLHWAMMANMFPARKVCFRQSKLLLRKATIWSMPLDGFRTANRTSGLSAARRDRWLGTAIAGDGVDAPRRPRCARVEVLNTTLGRRPCQRLARSVWISRRMFFMRMAWMIVGGHYSAERSAGRSCWISLQGSRDASLRWRPVAALTIGHGSSGIWAMMFA